MSNTLPPIVANAQFTFIDPAGIASLITELLAQAGSPLTLSRGGTDTTYTCILDHANTEVITTYFDDNTAAGLTHPVAVVFMDATCSGTNNPPQNLDSFVYNGRSYSVAISAQPFHVGGQVILYAFCAD